MSKRKDSVHKVGASRKVSASDLKNQWHSYLDRVSQAREEIVVTRYGKPVAKLLPWEDRTEEKRAIFGFLAGTVTVHGDIIAPTGEHWDADA